MEEWTLEDWERKKTEHETVIFYLYTPMCGTCAVASKMMEVIHHAKPELMMGKANMNYIQSLAVQYQIESVPCLLISKNGIVSEKVYAFHSIPHLLEKIGS